MKICLQLSTREVGFVGSGNKAGKSSMKIHSTIVSDKPIDWYNMHCRMLGHMKAAIELEARRLPFDLSGGDGQTIVDPQEVLFMTKDLLLALQPVCHLGKLILAICSIVGILCETN